MRNTARRRLSCRRLLAKSFALSLGLIGLPAAANAGAVDAHAAYVVNLAGINIASVDIGFKDDGQHFSVDIGATISGIGQLVARGSASADAIGSTRADRLVASRFDLLTHANGEDFQVGVQYASGNATGFQIDPPIVNTIGRIALERKHLAGVADPVASFILKAKALEPELCNRKLKIFTGMERYDIAMSFADAQTATSARTGYQGPVILCRLRYIPVSGHYKTSEVTEYLAKSNRMLIWYAPLADSGYFIPYRILLGTSVGDLSVVLTSLDGV